LCKKVGPEIYSCCKTVILEKICLNLERDLMTESGYSECEDTSQLMEKLSSSPRGSPNSSRVNLINIYVWMNMK